jgi:hypothetical protein
VGERGPGAPPAARLRREQLPEARGQASDPDLARERKVGAHELRGFYLYAIKKDGADLCATKKIARTCVPST